MTAIENKGKEGFLDGTITRPDINSVEFKSWKKMNSLIGSWIFNTIYFGLVPIISRKADTKDLWGIIRL